MQANYNRVAGIYDRLARVVFGDAIVQAQQFLVRSIPDQSNILLIGGGTGWILEEISKFHKQGLKITYVDQSEKMVEMARKRYCGKNQVFFCCRPILDIQLKDTYDVVVTPFLFDNFSDQTSQQLFEKITPHLSQDHYWLFVDFQLPKNRWRHQVLLKLMYVFFGQICNLEASQLPNSPRIFKKYGYQEVKQDTFYNGFISSVVYQKQHRLAFPEKR